MPLKPLSLATLGELNDGAAGLAIDAAIRDAISDVDDRGKDNKPRQVVITLELVQLDNGQVAAGVACVVKTPPRRTAGTIGNLHLKNHQPGFEFNTTCPEDPDQTTIEDKVPFPGHPDRS